MTSMPRDHGLGPAEELGRTEAPDHVSKHRFLPSDQQNMPFPTGQHSVNDRDSVGKGEKSPLIPRPSSTGALDSMGNRNSGGIVPPGEGDDGSPTPQYSHKGFSAPVFHVGETHTSQWIDHLTENGYFRAFHQIFMSMGDDNESEEGLNMSLSASGGREKGAGSIPTFFILLKSFVGTGVLFLPNAWKQGGWLAGSICFAFIALWCTFNIVLLVWAKQTHVKNTGKIMVAPGFGDMAGIAFGPRMKTVVDVFVVVVQYSIVCVYLVFVGQNIRAVIGHISSCDIDHSTTTYIMMSIVFYIPFLLIRKVKFFAIPSLIADVCILSGLLYVYYFDASHLKASDWEHANLFVGDTFMLYLGTAVFAFEGVQLCLPIEASMEEPKKFVRLLTIVCSLCAVIYVTFGTLGYVNFGEEVESVVLISLPQDDAMSAVIQIMYTIAIYFTLPLMFFPATGIVEQYLNLRSHAPGKNERVTLRHKMKVNAVRVFQLLCLMGVSILGASNLGNFVALTSALSALPLAFVFPPLIHRNICTETKSRYWWFDTVNACGGVLVALTALVNSIITWISNGPDKPIPCRA